MSKIDTTNTFMVAAGGRGIAILNPPRTSITADEALLLAAWLVSIAEHSASQEFAEVLQAVQST
jgi:hypothetical protein